MSSADRFNFRREGLRDQLEHLLVGLSVLAAGYRTRKLRQRHGPARAQRSDGSPTVPRKITLP